MMRENKIIPKGARKMKKSLRIIPVIIALLVVIFLFFPTEPTENRDGQTPVSASSTPEETLSLLPSVNDGVSLQAEDNSEDGKEMETLLPEDGSYTTKEDVSQYLILYGHLPDNFVTKSEAEKAGWTGGSLEKVLPGKCIGGDWFGNYEGKLPKVKGRTWTECDINTLGKKSRGAERLIFSNDGLIYYTGDHYDSFELIYGEP